MNPSVSALLEVMPLSQVYRQLTGVEPRRASADRYRAKAVWRNGDGESVSLDDGKFLWHDFVTHEGGRTLDLIVRIRGGKRRDALRWLSDFTGIPLEGREFSPAGRAEYLERRHRLEKTLPIARSWQRVAAPLSEELLFELKAGINNRPSTLAPPEIGEIYLVELFAERTRRAGRADGERLVMEYEDFMRRDPHLTSAMVRVCRIRENADRHWLQSFLENYGQ